MKHTFYSFFLLIALLPILSFAQEAPQRRVVYLWDVTYSMHGGYAGSTRANAVKKIGGKNCTIRQYNEARDIYDKILEALVSDIKKQPASTEIVVIPFGEDVLDSWNETATEKGKAAIIQHIRDFCNINPNEVQKTCISCAFDYSQKNIFSEKTPSVLKILTDGQDNVNTSHLYHILESWCEYAERNNIKAYYFVLAEEALKVDLRKRLEQNCISIITQLDDVDLSVNKSFVSVSPENIVVQVAEEYNKPFTFKVNFMEGEQLKNCKLRFTVEDNQYFSLDETVQVSVETKEVKLRPAYKMDLAKLRQEMPSEKPLSFRIRIAIEGADDTIELQTMQLMVTMLNKKMKTLTIKVKK